MKPISKLSGAGAMAAISKSPKSMNKSKASSAASGAGKSKQMVKMTRTGMQNPLKCNPPLVDTRKAKTESALELDTKLTKPIARTRSASTPEVNQRKMLKRNYHRKNPSGRTMTFSKSSSSRRVRKSFGKIGRRMSTITAKELERMNDKYLNTNKRYEVAMRLRRNIFGAGFVYDDRADGTPTSSPSDKCSVEKTPEISSMLSAALRNSIIGGVSAGLSNDVISRLAGAMVPQQVGAGRVIAREGSRSSCMYVVGKGEFEVTTKPLGANHEKLIKMLMQGDSFSELALVYAASHTATLRAINIEDAEYVLWSLSRASFKSIVGASQQSMAVEYCQHLRRVPQLASLSGTELANIAERLEEETYSGKGVIFDSKSRNHRHGFFLVIRGGCVLRAPPSQDKSIALAKGSFFGIMGAYFVDVVNPDASICLATGSERFIVEAPEHGDGALLLLPSESYLRLLKKHFAENRKHPRLRSASSIEMPSIKPTLSREKFNVQSMRLPSGMGSKRFSLNQMTVAGRKLVDFRQRGMLGSGSFASVYIVETQPDSSSEPATFAMKVLIKNDIFEMRQAVPVAREKAVLFELSQARTRSPFIVRLYETFQDTEHLYFLLELVQGGELYTLIHSTTSPLRRKPKQRPLSNDCASRGRRTPSPMNALPLEGGMHEHACRFYAANVVSALCHMHSFGIAYRDLKPENLLVTKQGYLKLVDFGFAKHIPFEENDEYHEKSYTLCGSPEYLAPELLLAKGHGKGVDWWALGAMIVEMMFGMTPFAPLSNLDRDAFNENQQEIYANITKNKWEPQLEPEFQLLSPQCLDLVKKLLEPMEDKRLVYEKVKDHAWFQSIARPGLEEPMDWSKLVLLELEPPHIPEIAGPLDRSQFQQGSEAGDDSDDDILSVLGGDDAEEDMVDYFDGKFLGF